MTEPTPAEPTMEEILASIRQIISEDLASVTPGDGEGRPPVDDEDDVLILTERAPPESSPFAPPPAEAPVSQAPDAPAPDGDPAHATGRELAIPPSSSPAIVAPETAAAAAASFERLSLVVETPPPPSPPFAVSTGGATLEDITRELIKPVLKAWLDENLPAIVQARVDEEVERIARRRVR